MWGVRMSRSGGKRSRKKQKPPSPFGERWIVTGEVAVLVDQKPWGGPGACILLSWCPADFTRDPDWVPCKGQLEAGARMKKRARKHAEEAGRAGVDPDFAEEYPTLYDYLTASCYDDDPKQPRQTSTLLVFTQDGCFKACLRDRSEGVCCWVAAPRFGELLGVLERELTDDTAVWRLDRASGAPEAKRKPREKSS